MKIQIKKVIREKSKQVSSRNMGFGFIYFNNFEFEVKDKNNKKSTLKKLFKKNFNPK